MEAGIFILFLVRLRKVVSALSMVVLAVTAAPLFAADEKPIASTDAPLIEPEVERQEIVDSKIDTEDFEVGFFFGSYSTEDFGTNSVIGATFAYHVTEDFFFEAALGETDTQPSSVERLGFFPILQGRIILLSILAQVFALLLPTGWRSRLICVTTFLILISWAKSDTHTIWNLPWDLHFSFKHSIKIKEH
ncbi:MAG: hypothetical protein P8Y28_14785 [Gammaproteobacteria bacterium]